MSTIIQDLNDCEPHILMITDAMIVAQQTHISRFIKTDFCYIEVGKRVLMAMLHNIPDMRVTVRKEPKFAIYYFSKPC